MTNDTENTAKGVDRALTGYRKAGGRDEAGMRAALQAALDHSHFQIGDEVICHHGSLVGVIIEIHGGDAVISWSTRGKSSEPIENLEHVAHDAPE